VEVDCITGTEFSFEQPKHLKFNDIRQPRQAWANLGLSDQFADTLGLRKGTLVKQYRVSMNGATTISGTTVPTNSGTTYTGRRLLGSKEAGRTYAGYFEYGFRVREQLPYKVGLLGRKKVFNIGAGFFSHPNGSAIADAAGNLSGENVTILDLMLYDVPVGTKAPFTMLMPQSKHGLWKRL
jgi:hypothetical protein